MEFVTLLIVTCPKMKVFPLSSYLLIHTALKISFSWKIHLVGEIRFKVVKYFILQSGRRKHGLEYRIKYSESITEMHRLKQFMFKRVKLGVLGSSGQ
jgi:hypothetical protein